MPNKALGGDAGHQLIRVMDALAPVIPERKGKRLSEFLGAGRSEAGFIGHADKARQERTKQERQVREARE